MSGNPNLVPKYEAGKFYLVASSIGLLYIGEKLLCFHGPLLYEAKCLDVKVKEDGVMYLVHYQGWNKNWDEWVTDKRIFKFNEEGLRKQKELEQQIKSGKKVKILRKSDLKKQSYPPPEIMDEIEQSLRPLEEAQGKEPSSRSFTLLDTESKEVDVLSTTKAKRTLETASPEELKTVEDITTSIPVTTALPVEPTVTPPLKAPDNVKPPHSTPEETNPPVTQTPSTGRRRKGRPATSEGSMENDEGFLTAPQLKMELPASLKAWLVDDWDLVTRQARLYELPASYPISSLMLDFLQYANTSEVKSEHMDTTQTVGSPAAIITSDLRHEFVAGLQHYFNQVIGSHLLYKFERLQYAELLKQHVDKRMSDIYGSMHLLRLFVKLREMIACTRVDPQGIPVLEALTREFLEFLHQNRKRCFRLEDYTVATAEYQRRAMC
ncbi:hypothetical protein P879_00573 [Paragonimus westermani]|uniref:Chromo domain-containing protein n=1 Tax=Paragonimus westermani TaxID=34504 RepID=A0A8T0DTV8_9TREM|nr:hypothetical protein P879_00573 [Paragonimus westermani]